MPTASNNDDPADLLDQPIAALKPLPSDPDLIAVRVGRRTAARLRREDVAELGLEVGTVWDAALAARVAPRAAALEARRAALRLVNRRALSSGELIDRLRRKGFDADVARAVATRLVEQRILDDESYGRSIIERERARRPAGRRLLRHKLIAKRLSAALIDRLLDEADGEVDDVAEARALAEKRLRSASLQRCDRPTRTRRLFAALARRGFDPETIRTALAQLDDLSELVD